MKKRTVQNIIAIVLLFIYFGSVSVLYVNSYAYEKLLFDNEMNNIKKAFNEELLEFQDDINSYIVGIGGDERDDINYEDVAKAHKDELLSYEKEALVDKLFFFQEDQICEDFDIFVFDSDSNLMATTGTVIRTGDEKYNSIDVLSVDEIKKMKAEAEDDGDLDEVYFNFCYNDERIDKFIENAKIAEEIHSLDNPEYYEEQKSLIKDDTYIDVTRTYMRIDDEEDWIYIVGTRNLYKYAFKSQTFFRWMILETAMFSILILLSGWAYGKYYDSKIRLERARVAFTKGVAHDMKTPLAIIKNCCECYLDDVAPEKNREYVQSIMEVADRMNEEVISFLSYNRLINQNKIEKDEIDFSKLVQKQVDKHLPFADTRHVRVKCEIEPKVILACDEKMMEVAVGNYLSNAIKYCAKRGNVEVKLDKNGELSVYNDCETFSQEQSENMWHVLEKGQADRNTSDGTHGMGLPIVSEICRIHNIKCGCKSTPSGVIFYMK